MPVFSLTIGVNRDAITYTPCLSVFHLVFGDFLSRLNDVLASVTSLLQEKSFRPFTQPILYGKMEHYVTVPGASNNSKSRAEQGDGGEVNAVAAGYLAGHEDKCQELLTCLKDTVGEAFKMCEAEMKPYTKTAFEFCQPSGAGGPGGDADGEAAAGGEDKIETDVEVLKSTLSSLRHQHGAIKGIP